MKEILKNKKFILIVKILFWFVFVAALFGVLFHERSVLEQQKKEYIEKNNYIVDFDYLKQSLLNNDFKYLYIVVDEDVFSYEGSRINNKYSGSLKDSSGKKTYNNLSTLNKKYPFLSIDHIFKYFDKDFTKTNSTFLYENDKLYVKIRVSIDNIINIEVNDEGIIYQLEISNLNGFDVKGSE